MNLFRKNKEAQNAGPEMSKAPKAARKIDKRSLANGSFATGIAAITIAAIVVLNMIVGALPSDKTTFETRRRKSSPDSRMMSR